MSLCDSHGITDDSGNILDTRQQWCQCFKSTFAANERDKLTNEEVRHRSTYIQKYFSARRSAEDSMMNQYTVLQKNPRNKFSIFS